MDDRVVIKAEGLTKRFSDFSATDHISFEVHQGEIFGFLGANGAGKTTAMRMLCGLSPSTDGKATVAGSPSFFLDAYVPISQAFGQFSVTERTPKEVKISNNYKICFDQSCLLIRSVTH